MSSPTRALSAGTGQLLPPISQSQSQSQSQSSLTPTLPVMVSSAGGVVQQSRQPTPLSRIPKETKRIIQTQDAKNPTWKMLNQYRVIRLLGRGTHGTVKYGEDMSKDDARDPDFAVAIKIIKRMPQRKRLPRADGRERTNSALARIRYEVAVMKRCSHDHIVRLIEVIDDPRSQAVFLVMEYLEGGEIKWRGPEKPLLSLGQTRRIVRDVLLGLEYLHYMGIIHRDIKPANMLWTKGRARVKLTDFGVAHFSKPLLPDGSPATSTDADNDEHLYKTEGTPAFYAPEQAYNHNGLTVPTFKPGKRPPGVRNDQIFPMTKALDIWAFGVSIYCFLFGKPPYLAPNVHLLCKEIIETDYHVPDHATADQLPTESDNPDLKAALGMMKGMMTKEVHARLSLGEAKVSAWLTGDLEHPDVWLRETNPENRDLSSVMMAGNETEKAVATKGHANRVSSLMKALWHRRENSRHPPGGRSDIRSIKGASQTSLEQSTHRQLPSGKPRSLYRPSADQQSSPVDATSSASSPTGTGHFGESYFNRALVPSGSHSKSGGLTRMVSSFFRRNKKSTSAEAILSVPVPITPIRPLDNTSAASSPPAEMITSMQHQHHHRPTFSVEEAEVDPIFITYSSEEDDDDIDEDDMDDDYVNDVRLVGFGGYETHGLNSNGISPSETSQSGPRIRRHDGDRTTRSGPILGGGRTFSTSSDMPTAPERIYDSLYPQHTHKSTAEDFTAETVTEPPSSPKQQTIYVQGASGPLSPLSRGASRHPPTSDDDSDDEEAIEMARPHRFRNNDS